MTRREEAKMIPQNARPASSSTNQKAAGTRSASTGKSLSQSEVRRGTYTPGRPAGVHARELGLKKAK